MYCAGDVTIDNSCDAPHYLIFDNQRISSERAALGVIANAKAICRLPDDDKVMEKRRCGELRRSKNNYRHALLITGSFAKE
jgi:hypothetical protein